MGVAGGSGSGKSTVVRVLGERLGPSRVTVLHHDAYYRDLDHLLPTEREAVNFDHPDSLETSLLVHDVQELLAGRPVEMPVYDFARHVRTSATEPRRPCPVVLVDGILVLADASLRDLMDVKVFVDTDADTRLMRRIRRDVRDRGRSAASVIRQYETTVRPMHEAFVQPSMAHADLVVEEGGRNRAAVTRVVDRIRMELVALNEPRVR